MRKGEKHMKPFIHFYTSRTVQRESLVDFSKMTPKKNNLEGHEDTRRNDIREGWKLPPVF